jgi:hypothetical protein
MTLTGSPYIALTQHPVINTIVQFISFMSRSHLYPTAYIHSSYHHLIKTTPNTTDNSRKSAPAFSPPFPFGPTSNGLPPPPKASGLLFAALVRWAWLVRVVAWPLTKAVERKVALALEGRVLVEDGDKMEVDNDEEEEVAVDVDFASVEVRRTVDEVVIFDLDLDSVSDDEECSTVVVTDKLLVLLAEVEAVVALGERLVASV